MKVVAQVLRLRPGCYDEYKRRHDHLWPELAELMRTLSITTRIFAHDDLLFAYAIAPSQEAWDTLAQHAVTARWDRYMADVLETDEHGAPLVTDLPIVFEFGL